jgi:hypothetical protein
MKNSTYISPPQVTDTALLWDTVDMESTYGSVGLSYNYSSNPIGSFTNTTNAIMPVLLEYVISWSGPATGLYTFVLLGSGTKYGELYYNSIDPGYNTTNSSTFMLAVGQYL